MSPYVRRRLALFWYYLISFISFEKSSQYLKLNCQLFVITSNLFWIFFYSLCNTHLILLLNHQFMQRYIKRGDQGQKNFTWFPVVVHWCTSTTSAAVRLGSFCSPQWWSRAWCVCKSCYSVVEPMCLWGVKLFRRLPFTCLTWSWHGCHAPPPSSSASAPRRSQAAGGSSKKEEGW